MRLLGRGGNDGNDGRREGQSSSQFESSQAAATITTLGMTKARGGGAAGNEQCD